MSRSLIGGGEPSTSGIEPGMWPRACAFGPRTSPTNEVGLAEVRLSQAASTTAGSSLSSNGLGSDVRDRQKRSEGRADPHSAATELRLRRDRRPAPARSSRGA